MATVSLGLCLDCAAADQDVRGSFSGVLQDHALVRDYASISGVVNGDVLVKGGAQCVIQGVANQNVYVGKGAEVVISGVVNGAVVNFGGQVDITGIVSFVRNKSKEARTTARAGAVIFGTKLEADRSDFPVDEPDN